MSENKAYTVEEIRKAQEAYDESIGVAMEDSVENEDGTHSVRVQLPTDAWEWTASECTAYAERLADREPEFPKDIIRAAIQGGTVYIERSEMEWAQAMGVDIREVGPGSPSPMPSPLIAAGPRINELLQDACTDCKGSGIYEGIISRGACEKCKGNGRV